MSNIQASEPTYYNNKEKSYAMRPIDFTKKLTFGGAFLLPFKIAPLITITRLVLNLLNLVMTPIRVLATTFFIDKALQVYTLDLPPRQIIPALIGVAATYLYGYVVDPISRLLNKKMEIAAWLAIQHPLLDSYAGLKLECTEDSDTMDLITRVWSESPDDSLLAIYSDCCGFVGQAVNIISCLAIIIASSPLAGIIISLASIPVAFIAHRCGKEKYAVTEEMTPNERKIEEYRYYLRARSHSSERGLFGYSKHLNSRYISLRLETQDIHDAVASKNLMRKQLSELMLTLLCAGSLFILLPSLTSGSITVGLYISLIGLLFSVTHNMAWNFASYFEYFTIDREYLKDYNAYISLEKDEGSLDDMAKTAPKFEKLEFRHVSFSYPNTDKRVLDDLSFVIEAGKRYSLLGVNGSGKTTITKLILRLYSDYDGEILINDKPISSWRLSDIKSMFSAVFQDFIEYDISLADNINAGSGLNGTREEIVDAIGSVGLSDYAASLPEGIDTPLGKIYDDGALPSGGQWQKIAIARAVMSHAQLKILDEPTASLDPIAEKEVYEHFDEISRNAATIFISHRLASAKSSDLILILDGGRITESGTHDELMRQNGLYAEMFRKQQEWYI